MTLPHVLWLAAGYLVAAYTHQRLAPALADDDGTGTSIRLELVTLAIMAAVLTILGAALNLTPIDPPPPLNVAPFETFHPPTVPTT